MKYLLKFNSCSFCFALRKIGRLLVSFDAKSAIESTEISLDPSLEFWKSEMFSRFVYAMFGMVCPNRINYALFEEITLNL